MPGYVLQVATLDTPTLSGDALDPLALSTFLTEAGFQAGIQQRFTARWKPLTEVRAQVLRFHDRAGADAYVRWILEHRADTLGSGAEASEPPAFPGAIAFSHSPCDGCPKDPAQYLAAWAHGAYVFTLLVSGPRAGQNSAAPLARKLDARVAEVS